MSFYDKILEKILKINYLQKERGSIFVLTALLLPIMFGCLGIAYDVGTVYMHKARLQNVADAAALAGGRAYLQSQTKPNGKDSVDGTMEYQSKSILDCTYNKGRITADGKDIVYEYKLGDQKTVNCNKRGEQGLTKHPDADAAADNYIYNNIVNLGNTVYADRYSHFALNYGSADSQIFYRIGLKETVRLRFLPVITNKYSETVRAGAIALVEPGQTGGGGGVVVKTTAPSIFDNLFTYSEVFHSSKSNYLDALHPEINPQIFASFYGNLVHTYEGNATSNTNSFYEINHETNIHKDHLYEDKNVSNLGGTSKSNDPTINTFQSIEAYVDAFRDKVNNNPHLHREGQNVTVNDLTIANINDPNSSLYMTQATVNGFNVWWDTNKKAPYINENSTFYVYDSDKNDYVYTSDGNKVYYYQNAYGHWKSFVTVNGNRKELTDSEISNLNVSEAVKSQMTDNGRGACDPQGNERRYMKQVLTNIFYFNRTGGPAGLNITGTGLIEKIRPQYDNDGTVKKDANGNVVYLDTDDTPVYIIIDGNFSEIHIQARNGIIDENGNPKGRPLVIVNLGKGRVQLESGNNGSESDVFLGTIYAPYSLVASDWKGTFYGNIIGREIKIPVNDGTASGTWIQKNYLENYQYEKDEQGNYLLDSNGNRIIETTLYEDSNIKPISNETKTEIEKAKNDATVKEKLKTVYSTMLNNAEIDLKGIKVEDMMKGTEASKLWYKDLSWNDKQKLYKAWKNAYDNASSPLRDLLWTWGNGLSVTLGDGSSSGETSDKLRLINFRTEYRENGDPNAVVDPFIYMTLGNPLAY